MKNKGQQGVPKAAWIIIAAGVVYYLFQQQQKQSKEAEIAEMISQMQYPTSEGQDSPSSVQDSRTAFDECMRQKREMQKELDGMRWIMFRSRSALRRKIRSLPC